MVPLANFPGCQLQLYSDSCFAPSQQHFLADPPPPSLPNHVYHQLPFNLDLSSLVHSRALPAPVRAAWIFAMSKRIYERQLDFRVNQQPAKPFEDSLLHIWVQARKRKRGNNEGYGNKRQKQADAGPTKLSARRAVKTEIHADAWHVIFTHCDPSMLFALKSVNREFRKLLEYEGTWKKCRVNNYGEDVPPPPAGLKEYQYLDLLDGQKDCMSCGQKGIRKTYWPFLRRWCKSCFKKKTMKRVDALLHLEAAPNLLDCIIFAATDQFYNYERVGTNGMSGRSIQQHSVCLREDVTRISKEYDVFISSMPADATLSPEVKEMKKERWRNQKVSEVQALQTDIETLEAWARQNLSERSLKIQDVKGQRKAAFVSRALSLEPPITEELLKFMKPFHDAIQINKPFSEKSWTTLRTKLEDRRAAAEAMLAFEKLARDHDRMNAWQDYQRQRDWHTSEEQERVRKVASEVIRNLEAESAALGPMDYQEFTIRALQEIHSRCEKALPLGVPKNFPAELRQHLLGSVLAIDDAIMLYTRDIRPAIDRLPDAPPARQRLFKCPGCMRNDTTHLYQFHDLFKHIRDKHACFASAFDSFWWAGGKDARPLWFAVPWPRNLPLLAKHQKADGKYDPDAVTPYKRPVQITQASAAGTISAFEGRSAGTLPTSATDEPTADGPAGFVGNIVDASRVLRRTPLGPQFRSRIALSYALEKHSSHSVHGASDWSFSTLEDGTEVKDEQLPSIAIAEEMIKALAKDGDHDLFNRLCCEACATDRHNATNAFGKNHGATPQSREELVTHYRSAHRHHYGQTLEMRAWTEKLFKLPTGEELWIALTQPAMGVAMAAFDTLFPKNPSSGN